MPLTVLKSKYIKCKSKVKTYRCFEGFDKVVSRHDLAHALNGEGNNESEVAVKFNSYISNIP